jgi:hypothetical protein
MARSPANLRAAILAIIGALKSKRTSIFIGHPEEGALIARRAQALLNQKWFSERREIPILPARECTEIFKSTTLRWRNLASGKNILDSVLDT